MVLTIANLTIQMRVQRAGTDPTAPSSDTLADQMRRRQLDIDIARDRDQAQMQWLLRGGNMHR